MIYMIYEILDKGIFYYDQLIANWADLDSNIVNNVDSCFVIDLDSSNNLDNNVNTIDNSIGNNSSNTVTDHRDTIQISSCFSSNEEVPSKKKVFNIFIFDYYII